MTTRYFKATDGAITYFRASATRVYQAAYPSQYHRQGASFSASAPDFVSAMPAVEITKAEYQTLLAAKAKRQDAVQMNKYWRNQPSESWVANDAHRGGLSDDRH